MMPAVLETLPEAASIAVRIREGDPAAERALVERFSRGVRAILRNAARNPALVDDLHQETLRTALERIRAGALRDPSQLAGFLASLARNIATEHFRRLKRSDPRSEAVLERMESSAPGAAERLELHQQALHVRRVMAELSTDRDRELLRRFYLGDEDKDRICADLGLNSLQFNRVLHRARERFRELWTRDSDLSSADGDSSASGGT
jgi:RNA polymerase sigma-70 factor (ECF subfamily)